MESRLGKYLNHKTLKRSLVGVAALVGSFAFVSSADAQLIDPRPPGEVSKPKTSPKVEPIFAPRPLATLTEPQDLNVIVAIASQDMSLPESLIRRILHCESTFDPQKININSGARGLWQIMPVHEQKFVRRGWDYWSDWSNPFRNTKVAVDIYREQGLRAWDCR
jgi:hypothetical protein